MRIERCMESFTYGVKEHLLDAVKSLYCTYEYVVGHDCVRDACVREARVEGVSLHFGNKSC